MVSTTYSEATALCIRSMDLMTEGTREDFEPVYHPEGVNREAAVEPPATRQPGPAGFWPPPSGSARHSPASASRSTRPSSATTWWSCT